ncbi:MAG: GNAT family N-acetyltransferase [Hyphomicrobiaceae bacterium]
MPSARDSRLDGLVLRDPRPGDIGWVVHRHGVLYHVEYGWDWTFEALVSKVASEFIEGFDPARDCCRIAEVGGAIMGSAFVVDGGAAGVAKLRLVYVEPGMRGTGLGRMLVQSCMDFAREAGYRRMTLWTNDVLVPARALYQKLGFELVASEPYRSFGHDLVSETWDRDL